MWWPLLVMKVKVAAATTPVQRTGVVDVTI
ncbi:hypothetical protein W823_24105 [Williamsia sp. D3]|nr:hypothetical protein W823_24105 [Williamsia sp. D3]